MKYFVRDFEFSCPIKYSLWLEWCPSIGVWGQGFGGHVELTGGVLCCVVCLFYSTVVNNNDIIVMYSRFISFH